MIEAAISLLGIAVFCWFGWLFVVAVYRALTGQTPPSKGDPTDHLGEV